VQSCAFLQPPKRIHPTFTPLGQIFYTQFDKGSLNAQKPDKVHSVVQELQLIFSYFKVLNLGVRIVLAAAYREATHN